MTNPPHSTDPTASTDLVAQTFSQLRAAARRAGTAPRLSSAAPPRRPRAASGLAASDQVTVPGVTFEEEPSTPWQKTIPTGPDGYPVARSLKVDTIGTILGREIRRRGWAGELAGGWVTGHWETLVGPSIAAHTRVEMIKDKTLFISCESTAWATNLRLMQVKILQRIAEKVGPDVIASLKIFGPRAPSWRKGALHVKGRGPRDTYG